MDFIGSLTDDLSWTPQTVRLTLENKQNLRLCESLSKFHGRKILPTKLVSKRNLQKPSSGYSVYFFFCFLSFKINLGNI